MPKFTIMVARRLSGWSRGGTIAWIILKQEFILELAAHTSGSRRT